MTTIETPRIEVGRVEVADTFPEEWYLEVPENGEWGRLILRTLRKRWFRKPTAEVVDEIVIPFHLPQGWPRRSGDVRFARITHVFDRPFRSDLSLLDGKAPWVMKVTDDQLTGRYGRNDKLVIDLTLTWDGRSGLL